MSLAQAFEDKLQFSGYDETVRKQHTARALAAAAYPSLFALCIKECRADELQLAQDIATLRANDIMSTWKLPSQAFSDDLHDSWAFAERELLRTSTFKVPRN